MELLYFALGVIIGILASITGILVASRESRQNLVTKVKNITGNNQAEII